MTRTLGEVLGEEWVVESLGPDGIHTCIAVVSRPMSKDNARWLVGLIKKSGKLARMRRAG